MSRLSSQSLQLINSTRASPSPNGPAKPTTNKVQAGIEDNDDDDDDELFTQMRQVRAAMAESITWFRSEREKSEKSPSSSSAARDQPQRPETDKERKLREFRYTPSRTEIRLRVTGAHGLLPKDWGLRNGAAEEGARRSITDDGLGKKAARGFTAFGNNSPGETFGGQGNAQEAEEVGGGEEDAIELSD